VVHLEESGTNIQGIISTITMQSVALFTVGATLLGIRRFTKDKEVHDDHHQ